jgi:hypothetical protein
VSTAKHFLSLPLIQHLTTQIYAGHLVYSPTSSRSLISDSYVSERTKQRRGASHLNGQVRRPSPPQLEAGARGKVAGKGDETSQVFVYNPYEAGWLDHQRLRVPKWRNALEFLSFGILLALFIATLASECLRGPRDTELISRLAKNTRHIGPVEIVFIVFVLGFTLDEFAASKEHGWTSTLFSVSLISPANE